MNHNVIKSISFAVLILASSSALAEWTKIIDHSGQTEYRDFSTVRVDGKNRRIWKLQDFSSEKCINSECYRSIKSLQEFDCTQEQSRTKYVVFYEGRMGEGRVVKNLNESELGENGSFSPVVPDTLAYFELQGICKKG